MKCNDKTFRQWFSQANAVATWRKKLWKNTQKTLGKLGTLLTINEAAFKPPKKGITKQITLTYIGGATDGKTLLKHIKRIGTVLEIEGLIDTYTREPTYTLTLGRLELKVKLQGFKLEEMEEAA